MFTAVHGKVHSLYDCYIFRISYLWCCSTMTGKTKMFWTWFTQFWIWFRCLNTKLKVRSLHDYLIFVLELWHLGNHNFSSRVCTLAKDNAVLGNTQFTQNNYFSVQCWDFPAHGTEVWHRASCRCLFRGVCAVSSVTASVGSCHSSVGWVQPHVPITFIHCGLGRFPGHSPFLTGWICQS